MCDSRVPAVVLISLFVSLAGVSACSRPETAANWDGSFRDSAGIILVENHGEPLWGEENRWTLKELLRIGTVTEEPDYQFGSISGIAVLTDGRIVVADAMAGHLKFFAPDGTYIRTVGEPGSGPGQFGNMIHLMIGPGDTLVAYDFVNMRVNWLDSEGTWLGSRNLAPDDGWYLEELEDDPSGRIVTMMRAVRYPGSPVTDTLDLLLDRDVRGAVLDTAGRVPTSLNYKGSGDALEFHFHTGAPDVALTRDGGMVTGRSDQFRLLRHDRTGRVERIVTLDREKLPFTSADRDVFMHRLEAGWKKGGASPAQIATLKSRFHFADTYPAWQRFICGPEGTVWVQRVLPYTEVKPEARETFFIGDDPFAAPHWDVFDREGRYLGVVDEPEGFFAFRTVGDRMYGSWADELGVQHMMVLRIEGLPPPEER